MVGRPLKVRSGLLTRLNCPTEDGCPAGRQSWTTWLHWTLEPLISNFLFPSPHTLEPSCQSLSLRVLPIFDASSKWSFCASFSDGLILCLAPYPQGSFMWLRSRTVSFWLTAEQHSDVCLYRIFFVHLLTDISVVSTRKRFLSFSQVQWGVTG